MARIRREDVEAVREKARIEDVVGEYVTLKSAGVGSRKGLCPFHDERTPSFHVRPQLNVFHCFGCGESGDVIDFVQKMDHLSFAEAVERLAGKAGIQLRYEDEGNGGGQARRESVGNRQRLIEVNRAAAQFYAEQLATPDAEIARTFLTGRGFDRTAAEHFGVGFAPRSGGALIGHLRARGFSDDELEKSGLAGNNQRGLYDRFRGRLLWPIRDITGDTVGFGARRLFDDDRIEAKYLNTPETPIYKKSQVLYGVDLARREIAKTRQIVVVEGYTDVMACHLAGVPTAVATCGTAFAADHIRIARRLMGDDGTLGGGVVFTFDGDEAGQKAAMRAFDDDQRFVANTFIAVARQGMDPCDLRVQHGDEAVRELVEARTPLFEFALRTTVKRYDLDHTEGRVQALKAAAPIVAKIRDGSLRPEYGRKLAQLLGMEPEPVMRAVTSALKSGSAPAPRSPSSEEPATTPAVSLRTLPTDPISLAERDALRCMLQLPLFVPREEVDAFGNRAFAVPAYSAVFDVIRAAGGMAAAQASTGQAWLESVLSQAPAPLQSLISELAVAALPVTDIEEVVRKYVAGTVLSIAEMDATRLAADLHSKVQRLDGDPAQAEAFQELLVVEARRRRLRERHG